MRYQTALHTDNSSLVVISGIDPLSSAYETATHPSTSYHQNYSKTHYSRFNRVPSLGSAVVCFRIVTLSEACVIARRLNRYYLLSLRLSSLQETQQDLFPLPRFEYDTSVNRSQTSLVIIFSGYSIWCSTTESNCVLMLTRQL